MQPLARRARPGGRTDRADGSGRSRRGLVATSVLLASHLGLLLVGDLAARPLAAGALLALAFVALPFAARAVDGAGGGRRVLVVAALLRLVLLPLPASLSDDLRRYVWDGRVAAAGANPYRLAPDDAALAGLRAAVAEVIPHRTVATVYPPLSVAVFTFAARAPAPRLTLKAIFAGADLLLCAALLVLARRLGLPRRRVAWYAWSPLATLEIAGMGHLEPLGVLAVALAVLALVARSPRAGTAAAVGVATAAGVLAKLAPLAALPLWARLSRRPSLVLAVALTLVAAALAPVVASAGPVPPGLRAYAVAWEFDGPLFEPLWRLLAATGAAPALAATLERLEESSRRFYLFETVYPYLYPQLLAKAVLAAGMLGVVARTLRDAAPVRGTGRLFAGLLLLSATAYPWYLLWVLPWAALTRHRGWLVASATAPLAYLAQLELLPLFPWTWVLVWWPLAVPAWWRWATHERIADPAHVGSESAEPALGAPAALPA